MPRDPNVLRQAKALALSCLAGDGNAGAATMLHLLRVYHGSVGVEGIPGEWVVDWYVGDVQHTTSSPILALACAKAILAIQEAP